MEGLIQLLTGTLGSVGFALIFRQKPKYLPLAALGGFLNWGAYLLLYHFIGSVFVPCLLAAALVAVCSELLAKRLRAPATVFLVPAFIPSIPGSNLYYTMAGVVHGNAAAAWQEAMKTAEWAFGIAAGISVVFAALAMLRALLRHLAERKVTLKNGEKKNNEDK